MNSIQISNELRDKILSFGLKGESYEVIINRIYNLAVKTQLRDFLMSSEGCISVKDALKEANRRWPRKKLS